MKVRWNQDSIRLRITPSELEAVQCGEWVRESLSFPGGLVWTITLCPSRAETTLSSDAQGATLSLSESDCTHLALPDTEGVYLKGNDIVPLRYYVEKDFPCAHPRAIEAREPETETFAAPNDFEARKKEGVNYGD